LKVQAELAWLPAQLVKARLTEAGIGEADLLKILGWAGRSHRLFASGFQHVHIGEDHSQAVERALLGQGFWHVIERVDESFPLEMPEVKEQFARIIGWDAGSFTWTHKDETGRWMQESWQAVHFDKVSLDSWLVEWSQRAAAGHLQDNEIDDWITNDCHTENSKVAWASYKRLFGNRAGKKEIFAGRWRCLHPGRGRGRLPRPK
jgi:hypothetical protein